MGKVPRAPEAGSSGSRWSGRQRVGSEGNGPGFENWLYLSINLGSSESVSLFIKWTLKSLCFGVDKITENVFSVPKVVPGTQQAFDNQQLL